MQKFKWLLLLVFASLTLNSQSEVENISIGTVEQIKSEILGEDRTVWVYVPDEGPANIYEKGSYPVVYLLDGSSHFHSVTGMIQQLSSVNGNGVCPKMIVVGILNTNRDRDLTPSKAEEEHPYLSKERMAVSGGGEKFMKFMEKELMPFIEGKYSTDPYRMLIGHSFGGLTAINAFLNHTELFNAYISIDPSMWWDQEKLVNQLENTELGETFENRTLYVSIANTLKGQMGYEEALTDTSFDTEHFRSIMRFDTYMKEKAQGSCKYQSKYYEDDDHGSVPLISEYDGLRYIFDFYPLDLSREDLENPEVDVFARVIEHAERLSLEFGHDMKPEEALVNNMGYQMMEL